MAALTAAYDTHAKDGELIAYGLAANTTIFKGALVEVVAGFIQPAGDTAGAAFVGIAHETVRNIASVILPGGAGPAGPGGWAGPDTRGRPWGLICGGCSPKNYSLGTLSVQTPIFVSQTPVFAKQRARC